MAIRIEAGEIVEVIGRDPTHNHYQRLITCTDDNELTPIISRAIHAKTREELEIVDREKDQEHFHVSKKCDYCGITLTRTIVEIQGYANIFCSRRCAGKFCYGD